MYVTMNVIRKKIMLTKHKDLKKLLRKAELAGLEVSKKGKHIKIMNKETNRQVSIPATPKKDNRTWMNMVLEIKRQTGFDYRDR